MLRADRGIAAGGGRSFLPDREKRGYLKMKKTNDFGRDSIPLLVLKTSVPFMFAQFVNVLYSIVDRIYVGNIPVTGADALAGVGV